MTDVQIENYKTIRATIDAKLSAIGRAADSVHIVAVSKTHPIESMLALLADGDVRKKIIFGENYIQEFETKHPRLPENCECHFIGHLQRNKAKEAVRLFSVIESVDSKQLAEAIDKAANNIQKQQQVYLQVNISRDPNKGGFSPEDVVAFISESVPSLTNITICGLMTITAFYDDPESARPDFRALRELRDALLDNTTVRHALGRANLELSMGMSSDYLTAIEEGATIVRIGTAIFGVREPVS